MSDKYLFTQTICPINIYLLKQYVPSLCPNSICPINIYLLKQHIDVR